MAKRNLLLDILALLFLCFLMMDGEAASPSSLSTFNCSNRCGNVNISFPFGMGRSECFWDQWHEIDCQNGTIPILKKLNLQVINISLPKYYYNWTGGYYSYNDDRYLTVKFPIKYSNSNCYPKPKAVSQLPSLQGSPFFFYPGSNIFVAFGSNVSAQLISNSTFVGCKIQRSGGNFSRNSTCSGFDGCCQTGVPYILQTLTDVEFINIHKSSMRTNEQRLCNYASMVSPWWLRDEFTDLDSLKMEGHVPVFVTWGIFNDSYHANELFNDRALYYSDAANYHCYLMYSSVWACECHEGYDGNPYLIDGCQDINECEDPSNSCSRRCVNTPGSFHCEDPIDKFKLVLIVICLALGALFLILLGWWLYREKKLRKKHFKRNGGLMLQQRLLSFEGNVQNCKLFNKKEVKMATKNFSESRVLGKGGQGTVYRGVLMDGRVVAVKKSLVISEERVEQFINEIIILTQINHRNIVKLLGCCLESEIPLLVYEFIPNGNLYEYLHGSDKEDLVTWDVRLKLATEVAGALFYLHSVASTPIYHRDIKSTNILLDEKHQVKIGDFGTSRLVSLDQTHVTTLVQGTIGYLDPEYFQTNQFTDKCDVYSFGVVLVELLTNKKPFPVTWMEGMNLAAYFILSMEDGFLFDILDAEVLNQGKEEEILSVANLAKRCLHIHGRNRPTMKDVAVELEGITKLQCLPKFQESKEKRMQVQCQDIFKSASNNNNATTSADVQPLLFIELGHKCLPS